jgi:hypothetical protein
MDVDLDTFLTAVYTHIDTLYQTRIAPSLPARPGPRPRMSDSEILTLMVVGQWLGRSQRGLLRWLEQHARPAFPAPLSQSAFNRRTRTLGPVCMRLLGLLAEELTGGASPYQLADTTAMPLLRQCRGRHHGLFGDEADIGHGGSDRQYYYGMAVLVATDPAGVITGCVAGPASTQERWLFDALVSWRRNPAGPVHRPEDLPPSHAKGGGYVGPTGPRWWPDSAGAYTAAPYLVDNGFRGTAWQELWHRDGAARVIPAGETHGAERRLHHGWRQRVETVFRALHGTFHLDFPGARSAWGAVTRLIATCAALNLGIWLNRVFGRQDLAFATLFPG